MERMNKRRYLALKRAAWASLGSTLRLFTCFTMCVLLKSHREARKALATHSELTEGRRLTCAR